MKRCALSVAVSLTVLAWTIAGCAKARWDKDYAEAMCHWHESCHVPLITDGSDNHEDATCELASEEEQSACLELIRAGTQDCSIDIFGDDESQEKACDWVLYNCMRG